jgi:predicted CopG family antitoxin
MPTEETRRTFVSSEEVETELNRVKKKNIRKSFSQIIRELILGKEEK